jgi:RimJ/RimL family protein N-acetyltransferase
MLLRPAGPQDEQRLLEWRNEPAARKASLSQEQVSPAEHHRWFTRKLADDACALLIVEEQGRPVGQIRLERIDADLAEISVGLALDARGRGIGREALRLAAVEAPRLLGVATVKALIKEGNEASLRAFRAAGFQDVAREGGFIELWANAG